MHEDVPNSTIETLIAEYIHNARYRDVLRDRLIDGLTYSEIADRRNYSERQVKNIVRKGEEKIFTHRLDKPIKL